MNSTFILSIFLLFGILFSSSCDKKLPKDLMSTYWLHAHEEDSDGWKAYRPESYSFKPSRGREGLKLETDGTFKWRRIAPTDGFFETTGTWKTTEENTVTLSYEEAGAKQSKVFTWKQEKKDVLFIRWINKD